MRGSLPAQAQPASRREWKMRRGSRGAALVVVAALVLLPGAAATARHVAGTQTFTVNVDGTPKSANLGFDAYFPKASTIHAGDTVKFHWAGVGEPHTTTFGTYANQAVLAYNKLTPAQQQANNSAEGVRRDRRAGAEPVPAGTRRRDPVGLEPVLPAERERRHRASARTRSTSSPTSTGRRSTTTAAGPTRARTGRSPSRPRPRPASTASCARCTARRCRGRSRSPRRARRS